MLVALATLTLPALMRMVAPMVSAIGNISAASAAGMVAGVASGCGGHRRHRGSGRTHGRRLAWDAKAGNLGSQALGSGGGGAEGVASGSALPAAGAGAPGRHHRPR